LSDVAGASSKDPSRAVSVKVQKWAVFSICLATIGIGSDIIATLMADTPLSVRAVLGKGELYMVSIGMLLSACGELLYDRARVSPTAAWEISTSFGAVIFGVFVAIMYGYVKSGKSSAEFVMNSSIFTVLFSLLWGLGLVIVSCRGGKANG
jgi:hypothetical protein